MTIEINQIFVSVKVLDNPKTLGTAILHYGTFVFKGFRITESKFLNKQGNYYWVQPPAILDTNKKYIDLFFCEDKDLWFQIVAKIIEAFERARASKEPAHTEDITEEDYPKIDAAISKKSQQ